MSVALDNEHKEDDNETINNNSDNSTKESIEHSDTDNIDEEIDNDPTIEVDEGLNDTVDEDSLVLTTVDNPHNPKTDHHMWKRWDLENGYNTEEYIARLIGMEEDFDGETDDEFTLIMLTNKVINEILENDDGNLYRLV